MINLIVDLVVVTTVVIIIQAPNNKALKLSAILTDIKLYPNEINSSVKACHICNF